MLRRAQIEAHHQRWEEAYERAVRLLELVDPHAVRLHNDAKYLAGRCLMGMARFEEARGRFQQVVDDLSSQSETAAMAQWMIGESYFHQQRLDEAVRAYYRVELRFAFPQWRRRHCCRSGSAASRRDDAVKPPKHTHKPRSEVAKASSGSKPSSGSSS
jgi:cellulose synthase operon protein C